MTNRSIFIFFMTTFVLMSAIGLFNYFVDPLCFYRCADLDLNLKTSNYYIYPAQHVLSHPEAQLIILGSSRGQSIPQRWVQDVTGLQTINTSFPGTDLLLKIAYLNRAKSHFKELKMVVWQADYFDLTRATTTDKTTLARPLHSDLPIKENAILLFFNKLKSLFDHRTLEASFFALKKRPGENYISTFEYNFNQPAEECLFERTGPNQKYSIEFEDKIVKNIKSFSKRLLPAIDREYQAVFVNEMQKLTDLKIRTLIYAPPYHKNFWTVFKSRYPEKMSYQNEWLKILKSVESDYVKVADFNWTFDWEESDAEFYWTDAIHSNCLAATKALKKYLQ